MLSLVNPSLLKGNEIKIWPKSPTHSSQTFKVLAKSSCLQIINMELPRWRTALWEWHKTRRHRSPQSHVTASKGVLHPFSPNTTHYYKHSFSSSPSFPLHLFAVCVRGGEKWVRSQGQANYKLSFAEHTIPTDNERISHLFCWKKIFKGSFILQIRKIRTRGGKCRIWTHEGREWVAEQGLPFRLQGSFQVQSPLHQTLSHLILSHLWVLCSGFTESISLTEDPFFLFVLVSSRLLLTFLLLYFSLFFR